MKKVDTIVQYRTRRGEWKRLQGMASCMISNGVCIVKFNETINKIEVK